MEEPSDDVLDACLEYLGVDDRTDGWHLIRDRRITASKAAVICGCSEYGTPWALAAYRMFLTQERSVGNPVTQHGIDHEGTCLAAFERATGNRVIAAPYRNDPLMQWLGATPDGLIRHDVLRNNQPALIEAKCPYFDMYRSPPIGYIMQTQLQMHVYGVSCAYLAAWFAGTITVWRIHYSRRLYAYFLMFAMRFRACVQRNVIPDDAVMQMIPHAAKEYAESGFCPEKRVRIAAKWAIEPHQLPPKPRIEVVVQNKHVGGVQAASLSDARNAYLQVTSDVAITASH